MEILVPERVSGSMSLPGSPSPSSALRPPYCLFAVLLERRGALAGQSTPARCPRNRPLSTTSLVRRYLPAQRPPRSVSALLGPSDHPHRVDRNADRKGHRFAELGAISRESIRSDELPRIFPRRIFESDFAAKAARSSRDGRVQRAGRIHHERVVTESRYGSGPQLRLSGQ